MTDGEHLLAAILDAPGDDTLRLVYADWLEETGDADRAEFVRVQIELTRYEAHEEATAARRYHALRRRERELLDAHPAHPRWLGSPDPLPDHPERYVTAATIACTGTPEAGRVECGFDRGMLATVATALGVWKARGAALIAAHPVTRVRLLGRRPNAGGLTERVWFSEGTFGGGDGYRAWVLPADVFDLLEGSDGAGLGRRYHSDAEAEAALTDALLRMARGEKRPGAVT